MLFVQTFQRQGAVDELENPKEVIKIEPCKFPHHTHFHSAISNQIRLQVYSKSGCARHVYLTAYPAINPQQSTTFRTSRLLPGFQKPSEPQEHTRGWLSLPCEASLPDSRDSSDSSAKRANPAPESRRPLWARGAKRALQTDRPSPC